MHKTIIDNVSLASSSRAGSLNAGRNGTVIVTMNELGKRLGNPHEIEPDGPDGKVGRIYYLDTPRGPVGVWDYWWNRENEQSIAGNYKACLWAAAWFRNRLGVKAGARKGYAELTEV